MQRHNTARLRAVLAAAIFTVGGQSFTEAEGGGAS